MQYEQVSTEDLIPYVNNARTHSADQVTQIAASIKEFGFLNPVIVDKDNGIIAGHGRVMAAKKLGLSEVPVLRVEHLSKAQKKAYVIADNQLALNAEWDGDLLRIELDELSELDFNLDILGFDESILSDDLLSNDGNDAQDSQYTKKINTPNYEPKGDKPDLSELCDHEKYFKLVSNIEKSKLPNDIKEFLKLAASRHIVFNFENIAEYYCHCDEDAQNLFEESALVIIDFEKAIESGFVELSEKMVEQFNEQ